MELEAKPKSKKPTMQEIDVCDTDSQSRLDFFKANVDRNK